MIVFKGIKKPEAKKAPVMVVFPDALIKAHIDAYTKKDGTFVAAHEDRRSSAKHSSGEKKRKEYISNALYTVEAVELNESVPGREWVESAAREDGLISGNKNPSQRERVVEIASNADPKTTLARPHGKNLSRSTRDVLSMAEATEEINKARDAKSLNKALTEKPMLIVFPKRLVSK